MNGKKPGIDPVGQNLRLGAWRSVELFQLARHLRRHAEQPVGTVEMLLLHCSADMPGKGLDQARAKALLWDCGGIGQERSVNGDDLAKARIDRRKQWQVDVDQIGTAGAVIDPAL